MHFVAFVSELKIYFGGNIVDSQRFYFRVRPLSTMSAFLLFPILRPQGAARHLVSAYSQQAPQLKRLTDSKGREVETSQNNPALESYYRAQDTCGDIEQLLTACRKSLPTVFRVIPGRPESHHLRTKLEEGFLSEAGATKVTWYPGMQSSVWKMGEHSRWDIKTSPQFAKIY